MGDNEKPLVTRKIRWKQTLYISDHSSLNDCFLLVNSHRLGCYFSNDSYLNLEANIKVG